MPPVTTSAQALQNVQQAQASQQSPDQISQGVDQSLGVPAAQQQVSGLRQAITNTTNLLNGVAPSVQGRTQNSLETSAQANKEIQNESAPIQSTLSGQNSALSTDQSNLSDLLSQASSQAALKEQSQSDTLTNLENIYKDLYGQEQDTAAAKTKAAEDAEQAREFNASLSAKSAGGGLSASDQLKQSQAASQQNTVKQIQANLTAVTGSNGGKHAGDNFVSPASYAAAANDWVKAGYSIKDFNNYFSQFKNPNDTYNI